jgi:hypothetical protein
MLFTGGVGLYIFVIIRLRNTVGIVSNKSRGILKPEDKIERNTSLIAQKHMVMWRNGAGWLAQAEEPSIFYIPPPAAEKKVPHTSPYATPRARPSPQPRASSLTTLYPLRQSDYWPPGWYRITDPRTGVVTYRPPSSPEASPRLRLPARSPLN